MGMKIILYRKSGCPWSAAVMGFLSELNVPYEIRNVTTNPAYGKELEAATGQCMSPTLDIDGTILADASVEDVAKALKERGIVI
jgi:glutaredoxin